MRREVELVLAADNHIVGVSNMVYKHTEAKPC
jgi:hypothetical protein